MNENLLITFLLLKISISSSPVLCVVLLFVLCLFLCYLWVIFDALPRYKITAEKPEGAIAGVQKSEEGPIEWSNQLPHCCQLTE